jgi:hypothetical protein
VLIQQSSSKKLLFLFPHLSNAHPYIHLENARGERATRRATSDERQQQARQQQRRPPHRSIRQQERRARDRSIRRRRRACEPCCSCCSCCSQHRRLAAILHRLCVSVARCVRRASAGALLLLRRRVLRRVLLGVAVGVGVGRSARRRRRLASSQRPSTSSLYFFH